jgi:hypothetical protein
LRYAVSRAGTIGREISGLGNVLARGHFDVYHATYRYGYGLNARVYGGPTGQDREEEVDVTNAHRYP